ncbi:MAG: glucuronate isomerase, partial [Firmicutes bacterium]|nr:glucuronate isomerase [Bacillota bacterium]
FGVDLRRDGAVGLRSALKDTAKTDYVSHVLALAGVDHVVMTNDPFAADERRFDGEAHDPRFHAALRLDTLVHDPKRACDDLRGLGVDLACDMSDRDLDVIRTWLERWCDRWHPVYAACSASDSFAYPATDMANRVLDRIVLPICRERRMPFALMLGVRRQVNPQLGIAGDGVASAPLDPLVNLCRAHPDIHFLATYLARENQHELVVAARKFRNLTPFGCWWFVNTDTLATEITRMRLELLGPTFIPQHSDARVLEHLLYKWPRARRMLTRALTDKYAASAEFGWVPSRGEVERDVANLLSLNFWSVAGKGER